jgi:hypothetical protein
LPVTNYLAHYKHSPITGEKSFIMLVPGKLDHGGVALAPVLCQGGLLGGLELITVISVKREKSFFLVGQLMLYHSGRKRILGDILVRWLYVACTYVARNTMSCHVV